MYSHFDPALDMIFDHSGVMGVMGTTWSHDISEYVEVQSPYWTATVVF